MTTENVNRFFHVLDQSTHILQKELGLSYLECLIETGENLLDEKTVRVENGKPGEAAKQELAQHYQSVELNTLSSEEIRQGVQLALLKGAKEDYLQPNHQMTPDTIGTLIAYLIEVIAPVDKDGTHIVDLSVGTGNLLTTVYHFLQGNEHTIQLSGVDNDELLLSVAATSAALQRVSLQLMHQDALQNLLIEPASIMVSDLPVGYYPLEEQAKKFATSFSSGQAYSHYLLIEQALNYIEDSGFGFFLVPANLFETQEAKKLLAFIQKEGYFQGLIQLPKELFRNEASKKAILLVQKKGMHAKQAKEVLLANAPEFRDAEAMKEFIGEINHWKQAQLNA